VTRSLERDFPNDRNVIANNCSVKSFALHLLSASAVIVPNMTHNVIDFRAWAQARSRRRHPSTWLPQPPPTAITDRSPAALWRADFEVHADQHAEVTTAGMWILAPVVDRALRTSLPIFQIGEIGTGLHLLDEACGIVSEDHLQALRLFVIETQEHARLLALVCAALEIEMLDEHWTEQAFRTTRYLRGFRVEMLAIVLAATISAQVYEAIALGVGDPTLMRIFHRLHADELRHLEFHAATFPDHLDRLPRHTSAAIQTAWLACGVAATVAVAVEHRRLFRACGSGPLRFTLHAVRALRAQNTRLFRRPR
jgi:hypothetical protein